MLWIPILVECPAQQVLVVVEALKLRVVDLVATKMRVEMKKMKRRLIGKRLCSFLLVL